jgi:hypothetical protein
MVIRFAVFQNAGWSEVFEDQILDFEYALSQLF